MVLVVVFVLYVVWCCVGLVFECVVKFYCVVEVEC